MKVSIRRRIWNLVFRGNLKNRGDCDRPDAPNKQIRVSSRLRGQHRLEIILHECLHAAFWDLDEEAIEQVGHDLARILWKLGYRDGEETEEA